MAKRRVKLRGRSVVALALVGFLVIASGVIWRRSYGIAQAREIRDADRRRSQLLAQRAVLEGDIRLASSSARLAPIAEQRLKMRMPSPTQLILLTRPAPSAKR
jgi:cell division protein FtsL